MQPGYKAGGQETPQSINMWNDRKVTETDTSCFNTWAVWHSSTILSTCVSGTVPKSFSFFYLLRAPAAVPWYILWIEVLDTANKSLSSVMGWGEQGGQREKRFQERKGESYTEKKIVKKTPSVFLLWLQKHLDFLMAQWQNPIYWGASIEDGAPQCPENKFCEKDWNGSFQFKVC